MLNKGHMLALSTLKLIFLNNLNYFKHVLFKLLSMRKYNNKHRKVILFEEKHFTNLLAIERKYIKK